MLLKHGGRSVLLKHSGRPVLLEHSGRSVLLKYGGRSVLLEHTAGRLDCFAVLYAEVQTMRPGTRRVGWLFLILAAVCGAGAVPGFHAVAGFQRFQICCPAKQEKTRVEVRATDHTSKAIAKPTPLVAAEQSLSLSVVVLDVLYQRPPPVLSRN